MKKQKQTNVARKRGLYITLALVLFVGAPVLGAILVQNFTEWEVVVETPPIEKVAGGDATASSYLTVDLGQTISNSDSTDNTPGATNTNLAHEEISFTCFEGDRTYYTDVMQLVNTTGTESWDVTLTVEADIEGSPAVEDTFTDNTAQNADIWLFTSDIDTSGSPVDIPANLPNPADYGSLAAWQDGASPNGAIQLEVVNGVLAVASNGGVTGPFTIPSGQQRQLGLVVDCANGMATTETGTFRVTVSSTPN